MRWTEEQLADFRKQQSPKSAPARKYRNTPTETDGKRFDSKLEARRYDALMLLWKAGEVKWFIRQVPFDLPGGRRYRADFMIVWTDSRVTVEDCKGVDTAMSKLKRDQVEEIYGITIELVRSA